MKDQNRAIYAVERITEEKVFGHFLHSVNTFPERSVTIDVLDAFSNEIIGSIYEFKGEIECDLPVHIFPSLVDLHIRRPNKLFEEVLLSKDPYYSVYLRQRVLSSLK